MQIHCIVYLSLWPSSHEIWACRDINVAKTHWCNLTASQSKICRKFLGRCLIVLNDLRPICWDIEDKINFYCSFLYVTSKRQIFWWNYYCLLNFKVYYNLCVNVPCFYQQGWRVEVMVFELFAEFVFGIMHNFPLQCFGWTKLLAIFSVHWSQVEN